MSHAAPPDADHTRTLMQRRTRTSRRGTWCVVVNTDCHPADPLQVNVRFVQRLDHPPTLALIKLLASGALPKEVAYIGEHGHRAIKAMQLVNRGRLSAAHD